MPRISHCPFPIEWAPLGAIKTSKLSLCCPSQFPAQFPTPFRELKLFRSFRDRKTIRPCWVSNLILAAAFSSCLKKRQHAFYYYVAHPNQHQKNAKLLLSKLSTKTLTTVLAGRHYRMQASSRYHDAKSRRNSFTFYLQWKFASFAFDGAFPTPVSFRKQSTLAHHRRCLCLHCTLWCLN